MLHSVGCSQPRASVFISRWNKESFGRACVHGFIDGNDGTVYQTLPWDHRGWHAGGAANNTHIGVEMCEPACITYTGGANFTCSNVPAARAVAERTYESAVELFAMLCEKFNLDPLADGVILSHYEGHKKGVASGHADPEHLWRQLGMGYTMDTFRRAVNGEFNINEEQAVTVRYIYKRFLEGLSTYQIAKELTQMGVKTAAGKDKWYTSSVLSILKNEKYKGDALLQKSFTKDFLTHKRVDNNGEVPQYYVEGHHEGIVTADQFEQVQAELYRRQNMDRYSGVGCFSSIIKCGECGSWYGAKVWHSNDKYRRVIYRCNKKYGKGCKCKTPHITEDEIKEMFIKAANELFPEKDEIIENTKTMMDMVCNTDDLDKELGDKVAELNIIAEQMQTAIAENSRMALDQNEYERRYADLTER